MDILATSVAGFCNFRDLLTLAQVDGRWRRLPEIAHVARACADIVLGRGPLESANDVIGSTKCEDPYSLNILPFEYLHIESLSEVQIGRRAVFILAHEGLDHCAEYASRACARRCKCVYCGRCGENMHDLYITHATCDTLCITVRTFINAYKLGTIMHGDRSLLRPSSGGAAIDTLRLTQIEFLSAALIFMGLAKPVHYDIVNAHDFNDQFRSVILGVMFAVTHHCPARNAQMSAAISEFFECLFARDVAGAKAAMPGFSDAIIREFLDNVDDFPLIRNRRLLYNIGYSHDVPAVAIGPRFAETLFGNQRYFAIAEQFAYDSPIFQQLIARIHAGSLVTTRIEDILAHAAKNPDERAFKCVYEIVREYPHFNGTCHIVWGCDEGFEVLQRTVLRVEMMLMNASLIECMSRMRRDHQIPRFEEAVRVFDFILARMAHYIVEMRSSHQSEMLAYLRCILNIFGQPIDELLGRHFAHRPQILLRIRRGFD